MVLYNLHITQPPIYSMNSSGGPGFQKKKKFSNTNWTRFGFNCHTLLVLTYVTDDELRGFLTVYENGA